MQKTILAVFGAALAMASAMQTAAAVEHFRSHRVVRPPVVKFTERFRNSNAEWPAATVQGVPYYDEAMSPPAGR
jgi:hypothetical protein